MVPEGVRLPPSSPAGPEPAPGTLRAAPAASRSPPRGCRRPRSAPRGCRRPRLRRRCGAGVWDAPESWCWVCRRRCHHVGLLQRGGHEEGGAAAAPGGQRHARQGEARGRAAITARGPRPAALRGGGRAGGAVPGAGRGPGPPAPLRPSWAAAELRPGGSAAPGLGPGPVASYSCPWPPECRGGASLPLSWPAAGEGLLPAPRWPGGLLRWGLQQVASAGLGNGGFAARRTEYGALGVLGAPPGRAEPEEL